MTLSPIASEPIATLPTAREPTATYPTATAPRGGASKRSRARGQQPHRHCAHSQHAQRDKSDGHHAARGQTDGHYARGAVHGSPAHVDMQKRQAEQRASALVFIVPAPAGSRRALLRPSLGGIAGALCALYPRQLVQGDAEDARQLHELFQLGRRVAALPLADGLPGDVQHVAQRLLGQSPGTAQAHKAFAECHLHSSVSPEL